MPNSPVDLDHHVLVHQFIRRHGRRPTADDLDDRPPPRRRGLLLARRLRRRAAILLVRL